MAKASGKGSIIYKLLIVIFALGLIAVITIPANIWKEEEQEMLAAHHNMATIYEAEKHYFRLNKEFSTSKEDLIASALNDSSLEQQRKVVIYTKELRRTLKGYSSNDYIAAVVKLTDNMDKLEDDLINNERYFKTNPDILNEAERLNLKLSNFSNEVLYPNLSHVMAYVDSLTLLQLELTDFTLQTAAITATHVTDTLNKMIPKLEVEKFESEWNPLSKEVSVFRNRVDDDEDIRKLTSVADRIRDFNVDVNEALTKIKTLDMQSQMQEAAEFQSQLDAQYKKFLNDFIVTTKSAKSRLAEADSLLLNISSENFTSPVNNEPYKIIINNDSTDVKVESPVLLEELKEKVKAVSDEVKSFAFLEPFGAYLDTLESISNKGRDIKSELRRNIEITAQNAEIRFSIDEYKQNEIYIAYKDLVDLVNVTENSESYSEIKNSIEKARNALSIFDQLYSENLFAKLDTLHADVINDLNMYNDILNGLRRMPRGVTTFENEMEQLNQIITNMKQKSSDNSSENLKNLVSECEQIIKFASEGKEERVFVLFKKKIQNHGYIYKNERSWEEKD